MTILIKYRENHPKFTLDKAPLQVDNLIKRLCNASLQRRFETKQRHQQPLQRGFASKQGGLDSLQGRYRVKSGGQMPLQVGYFQKHGGLYSFAGVFCFFAKGLC